MNQSYHHSGDPELHPCFTDYRTDRVENGEYKYVVRRKSHPESGLSRDYPNEIVNHDIATTRARYDN